MGSIDNLRLLLRPIARALSLIVGRGVLRMSDDAGARQTMQADFLRGETRDKLLRFGEFGWTSRPPVGSELVALFFGGNRDRGVVIAAEHLASRPRGLEEGEACAYNAAGVRILLKIDGSIEITAPGGVTISGGSVTIAGDLQVSGAIEAAQVSDALGPMEEMRELYNAHVHGGVESGGSSTAPPLPPMT